MFTDATLTFNAGLGTVSAISSTGTLAGIIDVTGAGVGKAPAMIGGYPNVNNNLGLDIGQGDGEAIPWLYVSVGTAGTGAGTVTFTLQAAPDNGSYSPGTYSTIWTSKAYVGTSLVAGTVIATPIPPYLMQGPGQPRFYALVATVASTATVSVYANIVLNGPSSLRGIQFNSNFVAA